MALYESLFKAQYLATERWCILCIRFIFHLNYTLYSTHSNDIHNIFLYYM